MIFLLQYIVYVILHLFLFAICWKTSIVYEKKQNANLGMFMPFFFSFVLILGLRYGRGADYLHYIDLYLFKDEPTNLLFEKLNDIMSFIGFHPYLIFFVYSAIFIVCLCKSLAPFKSFGHWLLVLLFVSFVPFSETIIRQGLSYSFVFLLIRYLCESDVNNKKRLLMCFIWALLASLTHSANTIVVLIIILGYMFFKKTLSYRITIPLYLFASYFIQYHTEYLNLLNMYAPFLMGADARWDEYIKQGDAWFGEDGVNNQFVRGGLLKLFQTLGECSFLYIGGKYMDKGLETSTGPRVRRMLICLFNIAAIGCILQQAFFLIELPRRMSSCLYMLWAYPLAYILTYVKPLMQTTKGRVMLALLLWFGFEFFKFMFYRVDHIYTFIWDAL